MLDQIISIVREAGKIVLSAQDITARTHEKTSAADLVTEYDVAVETFLKEKLLQLMPEAIFYGEEQTEKQDPSHGWAFIVDPIDGTTNFIRGFRQSSISVALAKDGQVEYGVVFDPYKNEVFSAKRGCGAFLNGAPIHVSPLPVDRAVFGVGSALYRREYLEPTMRITTQLMQRSCDFRRLASAALDLCNVACGRLEIFFEYSLCPWDYAAGSLIITEAGGKISTMQGKPLPITERCSVWCANDLCFDVLQDLDIVDF